MIKLRAVLPIPGWESSLWGVTGRREGVRLKQGRIKCGRTDTETQKSPKMGVLT